MTTPGAERKQKQREKERGTFKEKANKAYNCYYNKQKYRTKKNLVSVKELRYIYPAQALKRNVSTIDGNDTAIIIDDDDDDIVDNKDQPAQDSCNTNQHNDDILNDKDDNDTAIIIDDDDDDIVDNKDQPAQDSCNTNQHNDDLLNDKDDNDTAIIIDDDDDDIVDNKDQPAQDSCNDDILYDEEQSALNSYNTNQLKRYQLRGNMMMQSSNGVLLDQWPIPAEHYNKKTSRMRYDSTRIQNKSLTKLCCQCTDKCATTCPCVAKLTSCYSCNGPCCGNPFESDLFIDAPWLEEIETDKKGKGVASKVDLYPKNLLVRYEGTRITDIDEIQKLQNREGPIYAFDLGDGTIIDGKDSGIAKYINHSCDPNLVSRIWVQRTLASNGNMIETRRICYHIAKHIKANEELTVNYMLNDSLSKNRECYCESKKCKGMY